VLPPKCSASITKASLPSIISRECSPLRDGADVRSYIAGYTCLNDVSARDYQALDKQWTRAKSFDTFCPLGPVLETEFDITRRDD
jgi:2-keto-4-pentenoate hydratase/2-oxohepta-3-ene-1,7-dioic acid hydratase in catechol pathway